MTIAVDTPDTLELNSWSRARDLASGAPAGGGDV